MNKELMKVIQQIAKERQEDGVFTDFLVALSFVVNHYKDGFPAFNTPNEFMADYRYVNNKLERFETPWEDENK